VTPAAPSSGGDLLTTSQSAPAPQARCLAPGDLLPFLNDLAAGFSDDTLADVLTPTLSLFFQEWFKISPAPDLLGNDWRRYLGAISLLVQVKDVAASVSTID
jgi:ubiquitin conjugation factor E4 B